MVGQLNMDFYQLKRKKETIVVFVCAFFYKNKVFEAMQRLKKALNVLLLPFLFN